VDFIKKQLLQQQVRDDYREYLELSIIFLCKVPADDVKFKAPGALKIWLFRRQFQLTASETIGLRNLAIFAVKTYLKACFTAPLAAASPYNDFQLLRQLL